MSYYDSRHRYPPRDRYDRHHGSYYPDSRSSYRPSYNDSAEEVPRAYPPGSRRYEYDDYDHPPRHPRVDAVQGARRSHSMDGGHRPRHRHRRSKRDDRHRHRRHSSPTPSPSPPRRRRHRRRSNSESPPRSASRGGHRDRGKTEKQIAQAARAALMAGAVEAFRVRKEPGEWKGDKGKRVLTAAFSAGGTDGLMDDNPKKHSTRHMIESTLAGLATNHLVHGPRSKSGHRHGGSGSRERSSSHGGLKNIASTGMLAAAGKEAFDRFRSRSGSRGRGRSGSRGSDDDSRPHRGSKKRSKSVSDYISKGLAALGLEDGDDGKRHKRSDRRDDYSDDDRDSDYSPQRHRRSRRGRDSRDVGRHRPSSGTLLPTKSGADEGEDGRDPHSSSDSDLGDSSDEKGRRKKMRRHTILATGLATAATVHAAHSVYSGFEKRRKRKDMLEEGEITPQEARKRKIKANLGDAASVGVAAMGIKSAVSEWKDVEEKRKESDKFDRECNDRAARRDHRRRARSQSAVPRLPYEVEDPDGARVSRVRYYDDHPVGLRSPSPVPQQISY